MLETDARVGVCKAAAGWPPGASLSRSLLRSDCAAVLGLVAPVAELPSLTAFAVVEPRQRVRARSALRVLFTNGATIAMPLAFGLLAAATNNAAPMWLMAAMLVATRWPLGQLRRLASGKP